MNLHVDKIRQVSFELNLHSIKKMRTEKNQIILF